MLEESPPPRLWFARTLSILFLVVATTFATRPLVTYRAVDAGAGAGAVGWIAACFALLSLFFAVPTGRWVDRWGAPRIITIGGLLVVCADVWLVFADDVLQLALTQVALGFGHVLCIVGLQTFVANTGDPAKRDQYFGNFTIAQSIGAICGPLLIGLLLDRLDLGFGRTFVVIGALNALGALLAFSLIRSVKTTAPATPVRKPEGGTLSGMVRVLRIPTIPQALIAGLAVLVAIDIISVYLPAYGHANGIPVGTVSILLASSASATIVSRVLMIRMLKRLGRRRLLGGGMLLSALSLAAFPFVDPQSTPALMVLLFLAGFGLGIGAPLTLAWMAARAPAEIRGLAIGTRLMGNRAGQLTIPVIAGLVAGATGVGAVFVALAVLVGGGGALVLAGDLAEE